MPRRPATIPTGSWPRRMAADLAAAYCGEQSVDAFLKRVGKEYPNPRIAGRATSLMAARRPGQRHIAGRTGAHSRCRRGFVTMTLPLPRFVIAKTLADGRTAFYFYVPGIYRKLGCTVANQPLGRDYTVACGEDGCGGHAAALNAQFDEWQDVRRGLPITGERVPIYGSIRWLFQEYRRSKAFTEKVSARSRPDYERTMQLLEGIVTKKGDKLGDRKIRSVTPNSADKIYEIILAGPSGERPRQAEKAVALCRRAWRVIHRLYPGEFDRDVPILGMVSPSNVELKRRSRQLRETMFTGLRLRRSSTESPKLRQLLLFALSGCSARKMSWPATYAGQTTDVRIGQTPLKFCITKQVQLSGIRLRTLLMARP